MYFTLSDSYMFRLVAILRELRTKLFKTDNNILVLMMLRSNMV